MNEPKSGHCAMLALNSIRKRCEKGHTPLLLDVTQLKSSLFVMCAGGERIIRSRMIEAVTRVIIHYVFLDVVVSEDISANGPQEGIIRLRNDNVVDFVSDGCANNNSSNNNSLTSAAGG
jgi:hypothetical protein